VIIDSSRWSSACFARIDADRQPVHDDVEGAVADDAGAVVARGQRVPVGDEEEALVLVLEFHPVLQHPVVVTEVQLTGRSHAGKDAFVR
jgi:hypothetical protein